MARVGIHDPLGRRIDHRVEHREEHLRAREFLAERLFDAAQHLGRRFGGLGVDARGRHHECHDQGGAEAVARHVADHHADAVAAQVQQVVEVAAHRLGLAAARPDVGARGDDEGRRQQLELQVVRQLQLAPHPLLAQVPGDEPRVLDRRADLVRDRRHELPVSGGERILAQPVGQVDHADRPAARARGGVQHGDGEERLAAVVPALGTPRVHGLGVGRVVAHDPHLTEHARRNRAGVVHFDRVHGLRLHAARRDEPEHALLGIVHQQRGATRPHHRGHLAQDALRRLVQPDGVAQDLADRVDQVDLLVALGQLGRDLRGIALGAEHGSDDLRQRH